MEIFTEKNPGQIEVKRDDSADVSDSKKDKHKKNIRLIKIVLVINAILIPAWIYLIYISTSGQGLGMVSLYYLSFLLIYVLVFVLFIVLMIIR